MISYRSIITDTMFLTDMESQIQGGKLQTSWVSQTSPEAESIWTATGHKPNALKTP